MTSITCTLAVLLALITLPVIILIWATESQDQRVRRFSRSKGMSQRAIAAELGITRYAVRKALA